MMIRPAILWFLLIGVPQGGPGVATGDYFAGPINVATYNVCYVSTGGASALGPTAPSNETNNSAAGPGFDAANETTTISREVPDCWDGTTAPELKVYWFPQLTDAPALNETVIWKYSWRSIDWVTEGTDNGTVETDTVTYTETADPGSDTDTYEDEMTLAIGGNQTISMGDVITGQFMRDTASDTYSGTPGVQLWEFCFEQTKLKCDHY